MSSIPGFLGPEQLPECLKGCNVVVIPAGVPRKPGMLFFVKKTQGFIEVYLCSTVNTNKAVSGALQCSQCWLGM